ncbi:MAG: helix-turn-helix domain-containing protein [Roseobacter sp.]
MRPVEQEEISRGFVARQSFCSIALSLKRSRLIISREVCRNGGRQVYRGALGPTRVGLRNAAQIM